MKRDKMLDAEELKLSDEYRAVFRAKIQLILRQQIATIHSPVFRVAAIL